MGTPVSPTHAAMFWAPGMRRARHPLATVPYWGVLRRRWDLQRGGPSMQLLVSTGVRESVSPTAQPDTPEPKEPPLLPEPPDNRSSTP